MQNQFLPEEPQPQYQTPPVMPSEEIATHEMSERQEEQAVAEFMRKMKQRARRYRNSLGFNLTLMLLAGVLSVAQLMYPETNHPLAAALFGLGGGGGILCVFGMMLHAMRRGPGRDIKALAQRAGVHAIGPLIEMRAGFLNLGQLGVTYDTLIELLPQLKRCDVNLLNRKHRAYLYEVLEGTGQIGLSAEQQEKLRLAILEALKQVGDAPAVPIVRRLAKVPRWQKRPNALQQAAQECLPLLEANLASVLSTQTLLRASTPESPGGATLLRPAAPTAAHDTEQLLRAFDTTS